MPDPALKSVARTERPPDHDALMRALAALITDDMLEEIARADYGMDYDAHLAALRSLRANGRLARPVRWEPGEVLELFRWSVHGDDRTGQVLRTPAAFHAMRAFCCAALLDATSGGETATALDFDNQTLAVLIESTWVLGPSFEALMPRFLEASLAGLEGYQDEIGFLGLGLVVAYARLPELGDAAQKRLLHICEATHSDAAAIRAVWGHGVGDWPDRWLLGTTFHSLRHRVWMELAHQLAADAKRLNNSTLRTELARIAELVTADTFCFDAAGHPARA